MSRHGEPILAQDLNTEHRDFSGFWKKMKDYTEIAGRYLKIAGLAVMGNMLAVIFGAFFFVAEVAVKIIGTTVSNGLVSIGAFVLLLGVSLMMALRLHDTEHMGFIVTLAYNLFRGGLIQTFSLGILTGKKEVNPDYKESFAIKTTGNWLETIAHRISEESDKIKQIKKKNNKPENSA